MYGSKPLINAYEKYLTHEKLDNLAELGIEFVYEWEMGSMLIFDRTNLHCSSNKIDGKKMRTYNVHEKIIFQMFLNKIKIGFIKIDFASRIYVSVPKRFLKANSRVINFLTEKKL